jgi:dTDP-4-dehydrorhamnose reductase
MILLLGAHGYVGSEFARQLVSRGHDHLAPRSRELDATRFDSLHSWLREHKPRFVLSCAGYTGKPNVDACESDRAGTLIGNVVLPQTIAQACAANGIPWGHVSSGCIYSGARIRQLNGSIQAEKDLTPLHLRDIVENSPERVVGFTEEDAPNFSFRDGPCSFYSGTKALGEEAIAHAGQGYVWRLRIPFDHVDSPRNYLTKLQTYPKVYDNFNSISHRGDFARACIESWEKQIPFGTYNVTNPGFVSSRQVIALIQKRFPASHRFEFWDSDEEFYRVAAKTPRSNCIMNPGKLIAAGVQLRSVEDALEESLRNWEAKGAVGVG